METLELSAEYNSQESSEEESRMFFLCDIGFRSEANISALRFEMCRKLLFSEGDHLNGLRMR